MKIAFFSDNFYPELSGISDSIVMTGKELVKRGHKINYFVPYYSKKNYDFIKVPKKEIDLGENIEVTRMISLPYPTGTAQSRLAIPSGFCSVDLRRFNPDIIHTNNIAGAGMEALIDSRILRKPLVGTNHTPMVEFLRYSPIKTPFFRTFVSRYDAWYFNRCEFVSSPSTPVINEMRKHGFKKDAKPVSNPLDLTIFKEKYEKQKLKNKYNLSSFAILYAGRLAPEKHADLLIKSIPKLREKIKDLNIVIAGTGVETENLKKLAKKLNVENEVKFFGYIKEIELFAELFAASDVFAMLGTAETQSIVMMEAMALGLPVIAVDSWGLPDFVKPDNGILIEPNNLGQLEEKITYLYNNPKVRQELGEGGKKFSKTISAPVIAKKWEEIYQNVLTNFRKK